MVGKDMASSKVEEIGKELILMKMKSKGSVTMISKLTFIISTVTTYVVQVTTEITSVQSQIVYSTTTPLITFEEAQKQIAFLTSSQEAFSSVSTAITTSMASTDKTATNSALTFFSDSQTFFITISTLTVETLKTGSNTVITTLSEKLVTASTGGVSPSSGKFKLIFETIIQSITIFVSIIQIQIDVLKSVGPGAEVVLPGSTTPGSTTQNPECLSLLESFRTLKENEIAVGQTVAIIEMISNNTEFSTFEPSMCDSYLGSGYGGDFGGGMGSGPPGPKGVPCGSDTPKKTSIILKIVKGLKTGLVDIEETSTFSTAQTIVEAVFKFKFETFSSSDLATLSADSDDLKTIFESIKAQQIMGSKKIEDSGCTTEDYYDAISIPPCEPSQLPLKEELLMKLEGIFSNLEAAESTIEAVEAVIKGGTTNPTVTVDNFIVILDSLTAVLDLYNPCELFKLVIQQISSLLVVFSKTTFDATATQIIYLQNILIILIQIILDIIVQINIIQSQLSEITGSTVDPSSLIIFTIGPDGQIGPGEEATPMPAVLLPREEEAKIEEAISELKIAITNIEIIIQMIILIIDGTFTIDVSSEYSCDDFFGIVMEFLTLLIRGQFGEELEAAANKVIAVSSLSSACGSVTISYFKIVLLALIEINVNVIGALTVIVQRLIISRGLIVTIDLENLYLLSFEEQTETLELSLRQLREGCAMADEVSIGLELFLETVACGPDAEDSKEMGNVIKKITDLTKLMAFDIEDKGIINLAIEIQTLLSTLTGTTVNGKQCKSIEVLIIIIQNTVMTFVSQITILEQKNLQIGGELKFTISLPPVEDKEDFKRLEERNEAQLRGLMRCGDFTERSIQQSFEVFEFEPSFDNPSCNGKEVLKKAQRVTAMCSSEVLPIDDVAENTKDLARCSSSLSRPLNEREVSSLEFILMSCGSFAVTFSSQITIVQQKLTVLSAQTVTAADLFLEFIGRDGSLYPALPLDIGNGDPALVPVNEIEIPDDEPWFKVGRELFLVKQWTEFRFAFSTMQIVLKSISSVLDIFGALEESAYFCSGPEFLMKVSSYFTMIGQGLFTSDLLYDATFDIIKCASQVNMEVSYRIILLLDSITIGVRSFQMACGAEFIIIQQKLIQIVTIPVTSLQIEGTEFNEEGEVIMFSMGSEQTTGDISIVDERIWILRDTLKMLQTVMVCIDAGIRNDFTGLEVTKLVKPSKFLMELNSIILSISIDMTGIDIEAFERFISFELEFEPSGRQLETLEGIKSTIFSYCSMLAAEVTQSQSTKQDISNKTITETDVTVLEKKSEDVKLQIKTYDNVLESISTLVDTCRRESPVPAADFFNRVFGFYIMMVSEDNMPNEELNQFSTALTSFQGSGIRCITGSFEIVFVIVRIAITIYIEISTLVLTCINTAIFDITGQCPTGYELGDWNTGEGECCCDPNDQPEEPSYELEEPFLIPPTYEEPVLIDGEEPYLINGEEPVLIPGEEPVPIPMMEEPYPLFLMEEPVPINGNDSGYGEEPIPIPTFEEPVLIGGEEPVLIGGEEPHLIGGEEPVPISFVFEEPVLIPEREPPITGPAPELPTVPPYKPAPPKPEKKFCKCRKNNTVTPGPSPVPSPPGMSTVPEVSPVSAPGTSAKPISPSPIPSPVPTIMTPSG